MFGRKPTPPPPPPAPTSSPPKKAKPPRAAGPTPSQLMAALQLQGEQITELTTRIASAGTSTTGEANPIRQIAERLEQVELIQNRLAEEIASLKTVQSETLEGINLLIEQIHSLLRG